MKALLIAALAGAVGGFGLAWYIQAGRVDAAQQRTENAIEQKKGVERDLEDCKFATGMQNAAIEELEKRVNQAREQVQAAQRGRAAAERRANDIMQERTPADQNICEAASNAFDRELKVERGQ